MSTDEYRRAHPEEEEERGTRRRISGLLRSLGPTAQNTEDMLRGMLGEVKLPKEVIGYAMDAVDNTRREVVRVAAREFREFLESANLTEEIVRLLTTVKFEIRTEIRFVPNEKSLRPSVRSRMQMQDGDAPPTEDTLGEDPPVADPQGREDGLLRDLTGKLTDGIDEQVRGLLSEVVERLARRREVAAGERRDAAERREGAERRDVQERQQAAARREAANAPPSTTTARPAKPAPAEPPASAAPSGRAPAASAKRSRRRSDPTP